MDHDPKGSAPLPAGPAEGRKADVEQLRLRLTSAPPPYLEGALENPELGEEELLLLLRNRQAPGSLLQRIGRDPRWTRSYGVKRHLVLHPQTPRVLARSLVPHLHWRELAEAAGNLRVHPVIRRQAESLLRVRIEELSLGERIALARRASRGLLGCLIDAGDAPVLRALLGNPRMVELEAVRIAATPKGGPDLFRYLAEHPTWGVRPSVRMALLRNPRTPVAVALRLVDRLQRRDLHRLTKDVKVPKIVRVSAGRRLSRATGREPAGTERR
jgi:hypothetical protein